MAVVAAKRKKRVIERPDPGVVTIPRGAANSLAAFREWYATDDFPEEGRICFLDGELFIDMGHERISSHVSLKTALARALDLLAEELDLGQFFGDGVRIVNKKGNYSGEPDGCYLTWVAVEEGRVTLRPSNDGADVTELVGTPDMVIEIVSPSSVRKDNLILRKLYHRAGIPEYWLIDARQNEVEFAILRHDSKDYVDAPVKNDWFASTAFNREFKLERSRNRIGVWQYKLLHRRPRKS